jgi:hypothetical protein
MTQVFGGAERVERDGDLISTQRRGDAEFDDSKGMRIGEYFTAGGGAAGLIAVRVRRPID